jgi:hypothetical protein
MNTSPQPKVGRMSGHQDFRVVLDTQVDRRSSYTWPPEKRGGNEIFFKLSKRNQILLPAQQQKKVIGDVENQGSDGVGGWGEGSLGSWAVGSALLLDLCTGSQVCLLHENAWCSLLNICALSVVC